MRCRRLGTLVSPWRNWHVDVVIEARASLFGPGSLDEAANFPHVGMDQYLLIPFLGG